MKHFKSTTVLILILLNQITLAQTGGAVHFIGTDGNWFNPNNWNSGVLPDANTDIVLSNGQTIIIDPMLSNKPIEIQNLTIENNTELHLLPHSSFLFNELNLNYGTIKAQSSFLQGLKLTTQSGDPLASGWGCSHCGIVLGNPSAIIVSDSEYKGATSIGIGGNIPATNGMTGMGYYTSFSGDNIVLEGELEVQLFYGFTPQIGDIFQVITANNDLRGQFNNLNEGSLLSLNNDLDLRISYRGGDGNDVTLTVIEKAVRFIGTDGNWFEPTNWDSGVLPDANTDIVLTDGQNITIDPKMAPTPLDALIIINNIDLNNATLNLLQNSYFQYNKMTLDEDSLFDTSSSEIIGNALEINRNGTNPTGFGVRLNPTTNDNRSIKITANTSKITLFLGGTIPASSGNVGMGHYATLTADDIELDGGLEIDTIYGFKPQVGDVFEFIKARQSFSGAFNNYREGDVVASFDDVDLVLSYESNTDGSTSILLTSVQWPFRLSYEGTDGDWFNPSNWIDSNTGMPANRIPGENDDIVIAGDSDVLIDPANNQPVSVRNIIIDEDRTLDIADGTEFNFQQLHIKDGLLETHSSSIKGTHLKMEASPTNTAGRPGGWGCTHCGIVLGNPSYIDVDIQNYDGILAVGLGGTIQAQENQVGSGYYASFVGDNINISGELEIQLFYGFTPSAGDSFQIINANSLSGQFSGLEEGDLVTSFEDVSLYISYQGGNGNDVVLTALESNDLIFRNSFEQ